MLERPHAFLRPLDRVEVVLGLAVVDVLDAGDVRAGHPSDDAVWDGDSGDWDSGDGDDGDGDDGDGGDGLALGFVTYVHKDLAAVSEREFVPVARDVECHWFISFRFFSIALT